MSRHWFQLDGVRAVAVYLVLLFHAAVPGVKGGFIGVDVFFVLSGFLVTSVILTEIDTTGRLSLSEFYARRIRRLLPAAVLVICATSAVYVLVAGLVQRIDIIGDARASLLYFANWHFLGQANDYFAQDQSPSPFLHYWSLSIEEQFYFLFPITLVVASRLLYGRPRQVLALFAGLGALSVISQLFWATRDVNHAYYGTDARFYQLFAGVVLALAFQMAGGLRQSDGQHPLDRRAGVPAAMGMLGLLIVGSGLVVLSPSARGLWATGCAVAVIGGVMWAPTSLTSRVLGRPLPAYLGKISYGTYLWHWPVLLVLRMVLHTNPWIVAVLCAALATGLAALSFDAFEYPLRRNPLLIRHRFVVITSGLVASILAAALIVPAVLNSPRTPALASGKVGSSVAGSLSTKDARKPVPKGIDWKAELLDRGHSKHCTPQDLATCRVVNNPSGKTVLLVGDSFANMLGPMFIDLAKQHRFTLYENVVQGCPWPENLDDASQVQSLRADCKAGRDGWYDAALPKIKPDLVVMVMRPRDDAPHWIKSIRPRVGPNPGLAPLLYETMQATVNKLVATGTHVVLMQAVIGANGTYPLECLSQAAHVGDCAVPYPRQEIPSDGYMSSLAAQHPGKVSTVNINKLVCPSGPTCLPYRAGQLVWRDRFHLMTTFAISIKDQVWTMLGQSGATRSFK